MLGNPITKPVFADKDLVNEARITQKPAKEKKNNISIHHSCADITCFLSIYYPFVEKIFGISFVISGHDKCFGRW